MPPYRIFPVRSVRQQKYQIIRVNNQAEIHPAYFQDRLSNIRVL